MASLANRVLLLVRDHWGDVGKVAVYVAAAVLDPSGLAIQAIKDAINLLSKAVVTKESVTHPFESPDGAATTTGEFSDVGDKLVFDCVDTDTQSHSWELPAPNSAFLDWDNSPDGIHPGEDATLGDTPLADFISYLEEGFVTEAGLTFQVVDTRVVRRSI